MVKIYNYPYSDTHSRNDTDNFIKQSVEDFCEHNGHTSVAPIFVKRTSLGKPYVEGRRGVYVSVSHAERLLLVAVADCEVGIDCESLTRRVRDVNALASRFFTPAEKSLLDNTPKEQREEKFIAMWVLKEALVKLSGEGLAAITKTDSTAIPDRINVSNPDGYDGYAVALVALEAGL